MSDIEDRIAELEKKQSDDHAQMKPLLDLFNAGRVIGKVLFVFGGALVGVATIWSAISSWVEAHIK